MFVRVLDKFEHIILNGRRGTHQEGGIEEARVDRIVCLLHLQVTKHIRLLADEAVVDVVIGERLHT